ncbi:MAG TPA: M28 family metallopeptidase [Terriglobales bacterium]|nr:M28 family metallopeptidase [Terriglobales bacterium]
MAQLRRWVAGWVLGMMAVPAAVAQQKGRTPKAPELDPQIVAAVKDVSPGRVKATIEKLVSFHNRSTLSAADAASIAKGRGIGAARAWIRSEFERYSKDCGGCLKVEMQSFTVNPPARRIPHMTEIVNVVATLEGTDPANAGRIYLVSGHYDSRNSDNDNVTDPAPGANDDGSGTAVSLECARVLSKHKFPATIVFLAVAGEEQGLYGSAHYAEAAKAAKIDIEAVLNNDIVGGNRTPGDKLQQSQWVRVFSEGIPAAATPDEIKLIRTTGMEDDSASRQLARYIRQVAEQYVSAFEPKLVSRPDRYLRGGDHMSFNEQGFAAVRFTEYREDYNHQHQTPRTEKGVEYGDLPKFVDFAYVANVARLNAATLASLASAPAPPANVRLVTRSLENDSTLTWSASPGSLATRYEVLWRPTADSDWPPQNVEAVGNVTQATLKRSKDNVVFAVRAVDGKGHRSVAVVPLPER